MYEDKKIITTHIHTPINSNSQTAPVTLMPQLFQPQQAPITFNQEKDLNPDTMKHKIGTCTSIIVKCRNIKEKAMKSLMTVVKECNFIKSLRIEDSAIDKKAFALFVAFLKDGTHLGQIGLVQIQIDSTQQFKDFFEVIAKCSTVKHLDLQNNIFEKGQQVGDVLIHLAQYSKIVELDISRCSFFEKDLIAFLFKLAQNRSSEGGNFQTFLRILRLRYYKITKDLKDILLLLIKRTQCLHTLDLSQCYGEAQYFDIFSQPHSKEAKSSIQHLILQELDVGKENEITDYLVKFADYMGRNSTYQIKTLDIKNNSRSINWQKYRIFWENLLQNKTLLVLNLEKTNCKDRVLEKVRTYLEQAHIQLQILILNNNSITGAGLKQIILGLLNNKTVKVLSLNKNSIIDEGMKEFQDLFEFNTTLEELHLDQNKIDNNGLSFLARALSFKYRKSLKRLSLAKNDFSSSSMAALASSLEHNECLEYLNIQNNKKVKDVDGLEHIANALKKNKFLQYIDMSSLKIKVPCYQKFFLPALQVNIYLHDIFGKKHKILDEELEKNVIISNEIIKSMQEIQDDQEKQHWLKLNDKGPDILPAAIKFIKTQHVQYVNFSNMKINDDWMKIIAKMFKGEEKLENKESVPEIQFSPGKITEEEKDDPLEPVVIKLDVSQNNFEDEGLKSLIDGIAYSKSLTSIVLLKCKYITDESLKVLLEFVTNRSTRIQQVELDDYPHLDKNLNHIGAIQKETGLNKEIMRHLLPKTNVGDQNLKIKSISFAEGVPITKYFPAVVKCWKIYKVTLIDISKQNIEDEHIEKMKHFLLVYPDQHIRELILRQNLISDKGAEIIAALIEKNQKDLKTLELSRNKITDAGGKRILRALKKNTRLKRLEIEFGNQISSRIIQKIQREVDANLSIYGVAKTVLNENSDYYLSLSIQDQGPSQLRCAIKAVFRFNLLYLNLSDNLLSSAHIKQIAQLIEGNTSLRQLNLSNNLLDPKCGEAISKGLLNNTNLFELDLSNNILGDNGIALIVLPIAKQKMLYLVNGIQSSKSSIRLQKLFLSYNKHTEEALKHVYALMFADQKISVWINNPYEKEADATSTNLNINNQSKIGKSTNRFTQIFPEPGSPQHRKGKIMHNLEENENYFKYANLGRYCPLEKLSKIESGLSSPDFSYQYKYGMSTLRRGNHQSSELSIGQHIRPVFGDSIDSEQMPMKKLNDSQNDEEIKSENQQSSLKKPKFSFIRFLCGKSNKSDLSQTKQNCLKRLYSDYNKNKNEAKTFKCNKNILSRVECVSQKYITVGLYISAFLFYLTAIVLPLTEGCDCETGHKIETYAFYGIYAILSFTMELTLSIYLQRIVSEKDALTFNKFHLSKLITGQLAKADFFTDMLFLVQMYVCQIHYLFIVGCITLFVSSLYQILMLIKLLKKEHNHLLQNIERNCKLAYVTEHQTLAIILDSFSLSNFESIGKKTITVPKIVSNIKSFMEDLPQFTIQVIYIFLYSGKTKQISNVVISIMLGLFSFGLSVSHALKAKSSNVDIQKVLKKIEFRYEKLQDDSVRLDSSYNKYGQDLDFIQGTGGVSKVTSNDFNHRPSILLGKFESHKVLVTHDDHEVKKTKAKSQKTVAFKKISDLPQKNEDGSPKIRKNKTLNKQDNTKVSVSSLEDNEINLRIQKMRDRSVSSVLLNKDAPEDDKKKVFLGLIKSSDNESFSTAGKRTI